MTTDSPCDLCIITADDPHFSFPLHLVHPEHGKTMVWNVYGLAVCRECGAPWHRGRDNQAVLLRG